MGQFNKNTCFLITGVAGFIGANIAQTLLAAGYKVRGFDNFLTGDRDNILDFESHPNFQLIEGDMREPSACMDACEGIDYVLHQAALGSVPRSVDDPLKTHEINTTGTLNVFWAAHKQKVKRVVYASSSSVYGDSQSLPKLEGQEGQLLSPYAVSKKNGEDYAKVFHSLYGLEIVGLRYFNVFGPKQAANSTYAAVIPQFVQAFLSDEQPHIFGDGEQSRDFTYVDNVVQANMLACLAPGISGKVFNIACADRMTLNELCRKIADIMGVRCQPIYTETRKGDIKHSFAGIGQAEELMGYQPAISVKEGLLKTVNWYQAQQETV